MKNEYTVTWKLYRSWCIENMLTGIKLCFTIFWALWGFLCLWLSFSQRSHIFLLVALYSLYWAFLRFPLIAKKQYRTLADVYGQTDWTRTILFEDDKITESEMTTTTQTSYSDITDIREKGDNIWLILNTKMVIRLYKSAFVGTDWETCKAFIAARRNIEEN